MKRKKVLYLDCSSGISGDMTLGSLLDLGIDEAAFRKELLKLDFGGYELIIKKIDKHSIRMTDFDVLLDSEREQSYETHNISHNHIKASEHDHHHRNFNMIKEMIDSSDISDNAKKTSIKIFTEIAIAEGKVHGKPLDEVHFHEVGAIDSLVDIVGTAICLDMLGVEEVYASPLHEGTGTIQCKHGILPVPVPAVSEILAGSGIPVIHADATTELVTPTGAGIAKCIVKEFGDMPPMTIEKVGYGSGKRDTGLFGAVRAFIGYSYSKQS